MASERLTRFDQSGLEIINRKLETFDLQQKQIATLKSTVSSLQSTLSALQAQRQTVGANNLLFNWDGPSLTLSWAAGYIQDTRGAANATVPVAAGSQLLAASTYYWIGYNPNQRQVSIQSDLTKLTAISAMILVCRIFTGTNIQTGAAGGGGSETTGNGALGKEYKLF